MTDYKNVYTVIPKKFPSNIFTSVWRSNWVKEDLKKLNVDLYHGLSHEIPLGIHKTKIKSVVTIHDLIFERYPEQYHPLDVQIYRQKFKYACKHSDAIIAISEQTKKDIIQFYNIADEKIKVCYQSCNAAFGETVSESKKENVKRKNGLPAEYFLYVGSVIERKNLLTICKALHALKEKLDIPLVVIGEGDNYMKQVAKYIAQQQMDKRIIFLKAVQEDLPAIFQSALCLIYPSIFEGFGIPVLEALWSRTPVITSNISSLPEAAGDAALLIHPTNVNELANAMMLIAEDETLRKNLIEKGWQHAQNFTRQKCAAAVMNVYQQLNNE